MAIYFGGLGVHICTYVCISATSKDLRIDGAQKLANHRDSRSSGSKLHRERLWTAAPQTFFEKFHFLASKEIVYTII